MGLSNTMAITSEACSICSMTSYICCICEESIPDDKIQRRHYSKAKPMPSPDRMTCSKKCQNLLRSRDGLYKRMSQQGRDKRSKAVAQSNRDHPRRKRRPVIVHLLVR